MKKFSRNPALDFLIKLGIAAVALYLIYVLLRVFAVVLTAIFAVVRVLLLAVILVGAIVLLVRLLFGVQVFPSYLRLYRK